MKNGIQPVSDESATINVFTSRKKSQPVEILSPALPKYSSVFGSSCIQSRIARRPDCIAEPETGDILRRIWKVFPILYLSQ